MKKLFETVPAGVMVFEKEEPYNVLYVNESYCKLVGMSKEELQNANITFRKDLLYQEDWKVVEKALQEARELGNSKEYIFRMKKVAGDYQWHALHISYMEQPEFGGFVYIVSVWNVQMYIEVADEIKELEEKAKKDALTGLWNKQATKEKVEGYIKSVPEQQHALLIVDVDNFKYVNDNFGHLFGDKVIQNVAEGIEGVFRKGDIVGRVGGDEFLVLMKEAQYANVIEKAEEVCRKLRKRYCGEREEVIISCSVGIAFYNKDATDYDTLFAKADEAMYRAKDAGKNQYRVYEEENCGTESGKRPGRNQQDSLKQIKAQDENFLSEAFFLLSRSKEINSSLNLLLERIGRRYNLGAVVVLQDLPETQEFVQTNCWRRDKGIILKPTFRGSYRDWEQHFFSKYDERGLLCIEGLKLDNQEAEECNIINCKFVSQDNRRGIISFCSVEVSRQWKAYEKETFLEIANIVSVFVSLKHNQIENQETIQSLRSSDPLTGLLNENAFKELAQQKIREMDSNLQYAVVYTDIREFSYVNENFGNEAGNEILRELAQVISCASNMISCRLYSDSFVSILWDTDKETICQRIEATVKEFRETQHKKYPQGNVSLIAGIYFVDSTTENIEVAIENANLARKDGKLQSNDRICHIYTPDLRVKRETEQRILREFDKALEEECFVAYIQPKFLLQSMEMSGGEALVRWIKPDGTMEFPGDFIPVLEKTGYIVKLDFYVLEQVLKYMKKWKAQGKKLQRISVNFSRKHFEGKGIYEKVRKLTEAYGIEHQYIEVEITENLLGTGNAKVRNEMALLREDGFYVAIDDFGTGYSSLSMLHDAPADVVKIDKSFLDNSDMDKERNFIEKMGDLIHSVKETVVFEGIETSQQLKFLVDCGFQYGQGYLYERPIPIEMFEEKYMR